jgi:hypothetical protein
VALGKPDRVAINKLDMVLKSVDPLDPTIQKKRIAIG